LLSALGRVFSYFGIMDNQRESGVFYRSFYEAGQCLNEEQRGKYYTLIFEYMFDFTRWESDDPIVNAMFMLIAPQVEANIRKYFNWKEPKTKQEESKTQAKDKQRWSKTQGNVDVDVDVDVNDNVNVNVKKTTFSPPLQSEVEQYFIDNWYSIASARKAWSYYNVAWWKDWKWNAVKNRKQKMISVWFKDENKTKTQLKTLTPEEIAERNSR